MSFLLSAFLCAQEPSAEETFKKIEEQIEKAKTLRIKFSWREDGAKGPDGGSALLLIKAGNKALYRTEGPWLQERWAISDGRRMRKSIHRGQYDRGIVAGERGEKEIGLASEEIEKALRTLVARPGLVLYTRPAFAFLSGGMDTLPKWTRISGFKQGENDGTSRSLSYQLSSGDDDRSTDVTLWYDPDTLKPVRRRTAYLQGLTRTVGITETYSEFIIDADLPDETFKLPGE